MSLPTKTSMESVTTEMASLKFLGKTAFHVLLQRVSTSFQKQHASLPSSCNAAACSGVHFGPFSLRSAGEAMESNKVFRMLTLKTSQESTESTTEVSNATSLMPLQSICIDHDEILFNIPLPGDSKVITLSSSWGIALTHLGKLHRLKTTAENTSTLATVSFMSFHVALCRINASKVTCPHIAAAQSERFHLIPIRSPILDPLQLHDVHRSHLPRQQRLSASELEYH